MQFDKDCFDLCVELDYTEAQLNDRSDEDEGYSDKLSRAILNLKTTIEDIQGSGVQPPPNISSEPNSSSERPNYVSSKLHLPQLPLPEFTNKKGENLKQFFRAFEAIILKHRLDSYTKFVYLKKQLSNAPRILIDSLDIYQQSYEMAKELLEQAFDNTRSQNKKLLTSYPV